MIHCQGSWDGLCARRSYQLNRPSDGPGGAATNLTGESPWARLTENAREEEVIPWDGQA